MADTMNLRARIGTAETIDDYARIDADLRASKKELGEDYEILLGALNAKSAGKMFAIKAEIDAGGAVQSFMREASALRKAGYPDGGAKVAEWRTKILQSHTPNDLIADILADGELSTDEANKLIRLADIVAEGGVGYGRFEAGWLDVTMSPSAQMALRRAEMKADRIALHESSDTWRYFMDTVLRVESREALDVVAEEAAGVFTGEDYEILSEAIRMRRIQIAAKTFSEIVEAYGWSAVQALYERGDITQSLSGDKNVREFMRLMGDIKRPLDEIRRVDPKLGSRVVQGAWDRSGEIVREREQIAKAQERLNDRLKGLE